MKKSLLALAVAAALPAFAHAQTNVVLNGSIDVALESVNADANRFPTRNRANLGGAPSATPGQSDLRVSDGVWAPSRLAISGTEDLGGGLKGIFNIEHRFTGDDGVAGTVFWEGQTWVGLQGGFGAIRLGRQYTPIFRAIVPGDMTGYSWYNNSVGMGGTLVRFNNDVSYQSPSLGGFTIHAAYAAGETAPAAGGAIDNGIGDALGIAAVGSFGPVNLGAGYHVVDAGDLPGASDRTEIALSAGAKFGNFGVGLAGTQVDVNDVKRRALFASVSAGVGAGTVYLTLKRDDQGTRDLPETLNNDGLGLTYSHGLSKRTFVYASLGYNRVQQAVGDDIKPRAVALGVRHFF